VKRMTVEVLRAGIIEVAVKTSPNFGLVRSKRANGSRKEQRRARNFHICGGENDSAKGRACLLLSITN